MGHRFCPVPDGAYSSSTASSFTPHRLLLIQPHRLLLIQPHRLPVFPFHRLPLPHPTVFHFTPFLLCTHTQSGVPAFFLSSDPMLMVWPAQTASHRFRDNVDMESAVPRCYTCTTSASLPSLSRAPRCSAPPPMARPFSDPSHDAHSLLRWLGRNRASSQRPAFEV